MIDRGPDVRVRLALDYALGTLHGRARRRFERLLTRDPTLRAIVDENRHDIAVLAETVGPRTPPSHVWKTIEHRLGWRRTPWWRHGKFWNSTGLGGAFAAVFLAVALYLALTPPALDRYQATLTDNNGRLAWALRAAAHDPRVEVQALAPQPLAPNRAYELWYVPGGNRPPRSLGLMPTSGHARLKLPHHMPAPIAHGGIVAVSLEPAGGSPTGSPTGPILYQGRWTALDRGSG